MNQRKDNHNLKYQYLLVLSYFTSHYKNYQFSELVKLMGMTYAEVENCIDDLLELKLLVIKKQFIVISKEGEKILQEKNLNSFYFEKNKKNNVEKRWDINEPYIPSDFSI